MPNSPKLSESKKQRIFDEVKNMEKNFKSFGI